jgi:lambda repressor-like predicted transcriptional regulator
MRILGIPVLDADQLQENQEDGNIIIRVPYKLTPKIENYLNTMLVPFEYSQQAFGGQERRMLIPNLSDDPYQREKILNWLSKKGIAINVEEDLFTIKWWKSTLEETLTEPQEASDNVIADFIDFAAKALDLQKVPKITFSDDQELAKNMHSLGAYNPKSDELLVVKGPRLTADILRTLAHELVHRKQDELDPLSKEDGATGSPIENEANAAAGVLLRQFGKYRPEIFEEDAKEKADYKIYCDMDGVIVDFDKGYKELTGREASFDTPKEEFWAPIQKAGASFWIKLQWMPDGKKLWEFIKPYNPDLLSAPSRDESSKIGKFVWVKRNVPGTKLILRQAERKQEFATPNSILIDDRADNIQRWKDAGGVGILHTSAADTIQQLKDLGL